MSNKNGYWWCPSCKQEMGWERVTYEEKCDTCGHAVCWITIIEGEPLANLVTEMDLAKAEIARLQGIVDALRNAEVSITRWEADEYIMLLNGKPVGCTFGGGSNPLASAWASIKADILAAQAAREQK